MIKFVTIFWLFRYDIQTGKHDPYEDCVSAMRLYKRMRDQDHHNESIEATLASNCTRNLTGDLGSCPTKELENMTPVELYHLSTSNYPCWCLDRATNTDSRGESLFSLSPSGMFISNYIISDILEFEDFGKYYFGS